MKTNWTQLYPDARRRVFRCKVCRRVYRIVPGRGAFANDVVHVNGSCDECIESIRDDLDRNIDDLRKEFLPVGEGAGGQARG